MFQRILICTDFVDGLYRLIDFVDDLAIAGVRQIVFLHAVPISGEGIVARADQEKIAEAQVRLAKALEHASEGVEVNVEVQSGSAVEAILRVAKTYQTEMIVLGTQSRSLLTERLFGSTLIELARRTTTPLLVLRPQLITTYTTEELRLRCQHLFQYLLVPYDGSKPAKYTLEQVKRYAKNQSKPSLQKCCVCWVVKGPDRRELPKDYLSNQAQEALIPIKAELEELDLQVEAEVRQGGAIQEILAVAAAEDISAIALSSNTSGKLLEWFVSSFAGELLRLSMHPVLFFPPR